MSERKTIIVIISDTGHPSAYGSLKRACLALGWSYNYLKGQKLPKRYRDHSIHRVRFDPGIHK